MHPDITSRDDIDALMRDFYGRAMSDPVIGRLFTEVAHLDLDEHLPVIGDFWESTLFGRACTAATGVIRSSFMPPSIAKSDLSRSTSPDGSSSSTPRSMSRSPECARATRSSADRPSRSGC
jgi:hypothetical protein